MNGFILIDKPKGITSFSVCNKIKKNLGLDKTGHNGTLDPDATGLMVIACNKATKLMRLINEHDKEYIATIIFGKKSDTLDTSGNVLDGLFNPFTNNDLLSSIDKLKNEEYQIPPMTSAIKINGKKLYEYQRQGVEVNVSKRKVKINDIELLAFDINKRECKIRLNVSKGFYVRSFARDLGNLLNSDAIISDLRRTKIDNLDIKDSKKIDELSTSDIIKIEDYFDFPKVEVSDYIANLVKNGITLDERQTEIKGIFFVTNKCDIIALYEQIDDKKYKPILIF